MYVYSYKIGKLNYLTVFVSMKTKGIIRFAGATLWNELPNELRNVSSLSQFKSLINSWRFRKER